MLGVNAGFERGATDGVTVPCGLEFPALGCLAERHVSGRDALGQDDTQFGESGRAGLGLGDEGEGDVLGQCLRLVGFDFGVGGGRTGQRDRGRQGGGTEERHAADRADSAIRGHALTPGW
ncbi:hypothetical protein [Streptomyces violaceoruber]|uniref:hypothetical protein n=1 Tax=Streptomyces violaceoruber TaxID=1935 RepID=UPI00403CBE54